MASGDFPGIHSLSHLCWDQLYVGFSRAQPCSSIWNNSWHLFHGHAEQELFHAQAELMSTLGLWTGSLVGILWTNFSSCPSFFLRGFASGCWGSCPPSLIRKVEETWPLESLTLDLMSPFSPLCISFPHSNSKTTIFWFGVQCIWELPFLFFLIEQKSGIQHIIYFVSRKDFKNCCSIAKPCLTLCNPMDCSMPGFPVLHYLLEFAQTHVHWISDAIQPSHPLLPSSPLVLSLSQPQGLFQWVRSLHQVARVLELQLQICPSNECSGSISFRIDCFDLLAAQGTLKSLLQHHSSKASILWCLAFVMVQISHCT